MLHKAIPNAEGITRGRRTDIMLELSTAVLAKETVDRLDIIVKDENLQNSGEPWTRASIIDYLIKDYMDKCRDLAALY